MAPSIEIIDDPEDNPGDYGTRPRAPYQKEPSNARSPSLSAHSPYSPMNRDHRRTSQTPLFAHAPGGNQPYHQWSDRPYSARPDLNSHHSSSTASHHPNGSQNASARSPHIVHPARVSSANGHSKTAAKRSVGLGQSPHNRSHPAQKPTSQSDATYAPPARPADQSQRSRDIPDALSNRDGYQRVVSNAVKRPRGLGDEDALMHEISVKKARTAGQTGDTRASGGRPEQHKHATTSSPRPTSTPRPGTTTSYSPTVNGHSRHGASTKSAPKASNPAFVIDLTDDADDDITAVQKAPPSDIHDAKVVKSSQMNRPTTQNPEASSTGAKSSSSTVGGKKIKGVAYYRPKEQDGQRGAPSLDISVASGTAKDPYREKDGEKARTMPKDGAKGKSASNVETLASSSRGKRGDDSGYTSHESAEKVAIREESESSKRASASSETAGKKHERQSATPNGPKTSSGPIPSHLRTTSGGARSSPESQKHAPSAATKAKKNKTSGAATLNSEQAKDGGDTTDDETDEEAKARIRALRAAAVTEPSGPRSDEASGAQLLEDEIQEQLRQEERQKAEELPKASVENPDHNTFAVPALPSTKVGVSPQLFSSLGVTVERVLGKQVEDLRAHNEFYTRIWLQRARESFDVSVDQPSHSNEQQPYSFASYQPIQTTQKNAISGPKEHVTIELLRGTKAKLSVAVPVNRFITDDNQPPYNHYVHIQNNYLALNETNLHCQPYFSDDFDDSQAVNLTAQYNYDTVDRPQKLLRLLQAQSYDSFVTSTLQQLDIAWADVLRFLLDPKPNVGQDPEALRALADREKYCQEDFPGRDMTRSLKVFASLPPSSPDKLGLAASVCERFFKMANLSLWHVARRHMFDYMPSTDANKNLSEEEMTCRVCFRYGCAFHGEIKQSESEDSFDGDELVDDATKRDIIHPLQINYRTRVAFPTNVPPASSGAVARRGANGHQDKYIWKPDEREPFYPCDHPGTSCETAQCRCFVENIHCEKSCSCSTACPRRFAGCKCSYEVSMGKECQGRKTMCFQDDRCACFNLGRECDPDLCGPCRVVEVLDPINREDDTILTGRCRNASIQRGVTKHTLFGDSAIHGYGLFAGEDIKAHEFVGEYKGEVITKPEAERRGAVYEHQKLSYLFALNVSQEIDSTYFGNKIRFINHAGNGKHNLYPRIIMVNGVHRIALYGQRSVKKGYELFFDYGPLFPGDQLDGAKTPKAAQAKGKGKINTPHVRNARAVLEDFHEVGYSEDEDGNARARKVAGTRSRPVKARAIKKPRGKKRLKSARELVNPTATSSRVTELLPLNPYGAGSALTPAATGTTLQPSGRREEDENSRIDPEDAEERVANYYVRNDMDMDDDNLIERRGKATSEADSDDANYVPRDAEPSDDDDYEDAMEVDESAEEDDSDDDEEDGSPVKRGRAPKSSLNGPGKRRGGLFSVVRKRKG